MSEDKKSVHPVDLHVGMRLKLRRQMLELSQNELGQRLGITFQQIQKYEKGTNRIGASRLYELAKALNIRVQYFFENYEGFGSNYPHHDIDDMKANLAKTAESQQFLQYYFEIKDDEVRKRLIDFIKTMSKESRKTP